MDERKLKFFLALQKRIEESKNLSQRIKDKFYALAENEIGKLDIMENLVITTTELANAYKKNGYVPIDLGEVEISITDKKRKPEAATYDLNKHKPIDVTAFLSLFSSDDHPFKYLVHDLTKPGQTFILERLLKEVEEKFAIETRKYLIPKSLYSRLRVFIGPSNMSWYFKDKPMSFSFHSDKVKKWCTENPNKHPLLHFQYEIKAFKESIRIEENLKELIEFVLAKKGLLTSFDIDYEKIGRPNFYTDVDAFISGLGIIFNSFHQRIQNGNKVRVALETKRDGNQRMRILKITHVGSTCAKELKETELLGGDLKEVKKFFYQLCDWSIISINPNPNINKMNLLYNPTTGKKPYEKIEETIDGFTHVLTFYS